ncbi:hypothetical protein ACIPQJ_11880 [Streptomyces sp. NPDC090082]|uniref:hypothetical protein n=1 Tax=Streptomyces sp. NPDC090082 TaxID=3365940 RepID=UPI00382AC90D
MAVAKAVFSNSASGAAAPLAVLKVTEVSGRAAAADTGSAIEAAIARATDLRPRLEDLVVLMFCDAFPEGVALFTGKKAILSLLAPDSISGADAAMHRDLIPSGAERAVDGRAVFTTGAAHSVVACPERCGF